MLDNLSDLGNKNSEKRVSWFWVHWFMILWASEMNWVCQWNSHQLERRMTMLLFGLAHIQEESRYIMILNGKSGAPSYGTKSNPSHPSLLIPTYPTYPPLDWDVLDRIDPGWMATRQWGILCLACATQTQPNGMKIKGNCKILCWMRNLRVPQPIPEVVTHNNTIKLLDWTRGTCGTCVWYAYGR